MYVYIPQLIFMNNLAQNCATLLACFVQELYICMYIHTFSQTSMGVRRSATERHSYISIGQCHHHTSESSLISSAKFRAFGATTLAHVVLYAVVVIGKCSCCNCANCLTERERASVYVDVRLGEAKNKAGVLSVRRERSTHTHAQWVEEESRPLSGLLNDQSTYCLVGVATATTTATATAKTSATVAAAD